MISTVAVFVLENLESLLLIVAGSQPALPTTANSETNNEVASLEESSVSSASSSVCMSTVAFCLLEPLESLLNFAKESPATPTTTTDTKTDDGSWSCGSSDSFSSTSSSGYSVEFDKVTVHVNVIKLGWVEIPYTAVHDVDTFERMRSSRQAVRQQRQILEQRPSDGVMMIFMSIFALSILEPLISILRIIFGLPTIEAKNITKIERRPTIRRPRYMSIVDRLKAQSKRGDSKRGDSKRGTTWTN